MIQPKYIAAWMRYVRDNPQDKRFLECFWESQMESKKWLLEEMKNFCPEPKNIIIFGGWFGVLANMFESTNPSLEKIITLDSDPDCPRRIQGSSPIGTNAIVIRTMCMSLYKYVEEFDFIVNTSAEHVTQDIYDLWWNNIPKGTLVAIQSNNFESIEEHIRCSTDINNFLEMNHVKNPLFSGEIDCGGFSRYMAITRK